MAQRHIYWCRACRRRFHVQVPLCARVCGPTPEEQAQAAEWKAGIRCGHCGGAKVEPFHYEKHPPEGGRRIAFAARLSHDNRSTYREDLARARRGMPRAEPKPTCPRCGSEGIVVEPGRPCPECGAKE